MGRAGLQKTLQTILARSEKRGLHFSVILFSIDRFKLVNSRFGHHHADAVLQRVAAVTKRVLGTRGKIGRWGGDEFLCILPDTTATHSKKIAEELRQAIENIIIPVESSLMNTTASFGIAVFPEDGNQIKYLMVSADEALYKAKHTGRNRVVPASSLERHVFLMGGILETALREDRIMPAYQPIVDLKTEAVVAEEALARLVTTEGAVLPAEDFIEVASQFQLTHKVDRCIVLSAFNRCAACLNDKNPITHFINISADLLRHPNVLHELLQSAKSHCGSYKNLIKPLVIEVTERELLGNLDATRRTFEPFLDFGLRLALDDFVSGYSSFQYLADLPISFLKIDGRLIKRIHEPKVRAIIAGIQNIAAELGIITLAEFVESEHQADLLRSTGINWAQGYYYGEAVLNEAEADARRAMSVNW